MKKLVSVFLAVVLALSLSAVALAEDSANTINPNAGMVAGAGRTVTWTDVFTVAEGDNITQNLPAATFNYTIAAGTGAVATSSSPLVKGGVGAPTINNAVHAATTPTSTPPTTSEVDVTADFTDVTFTEAGIYRYNVTEELDTSNSAVDIEIDVNNDNKGTYVLDVYVKKIPGTNGAEDTFEPYAYALSKTGEFASFIHDKPNNVWNATYEGAEDGTGKVNEIVNELTTYDLTVTKTIVGDVAANEFEFTISITEVPSDVYIKLDDKAPVAGNQTFTVKLGNGGKTVIKGLPSYAKYAIKEAVNRLEGYEVDVVETKADPKADAGEYDWIPKADNAVAYGINDKAVAMGKGAVKVDYTNTLDNISPTGVVLRVAPYALIMVAGVALLLISHRRRTEKE